MPAQNWIKQAMWKWLGTQLYHTPERRRRKGKDAMLCVSKFIWLNSCNFFKNPNLLFIIFYFFLITLFLAIWSSVLWFFNYVTLGFPTSISNRGWAYIIIHSSLHFFTQTLFKQRMLTGYTQTFTIIEFIVELLSLCGGLTDVTTTMIT